MPNMNITLRPFAEKDADVVIDILMHHEVKKTFMVPDFPGREDAKRLFDRMQALSTQENRFVRAICLGENAVGFLNDVGISGQEIELGYVIHPDQKGRGYATRALIAAIDALLERGFETVKAGAFEENLASLRVMEKAGMEKTAETEEIEYRGKKHNCVYYQIHKSEVTK